MTTTQSKKKFFSSRNQPSTIKNLTEVTVFQLPYLRVLCVSTSHFLAELFFPKQLEIQTSFTLIKISPFSNL